jgi:hypothetical protein
MSNDYGKPRKRFLVQVKERHGKTWRQHLLCDTHNAARAAVDHLSAIDAKHTYRVEGEPRPARAALPPLDTAQPLAKNRASTEYPNPHIPNIRKAISTNTRTTAMRAWDYPKETVAVACPECQRFGRYPKARFIELVGSGTSLSNALRFLAKDCPRKGDVAICKESGCKIYFPEL